MKDYKIIIDSKDVYANLLKYKSRIDSIIKEHSLDKEVTLEIIPEGPLPGLLNLYRMTQPWIKFSKEFHEVRLPKQTQSSLPNFRSTTINPIVIKASSNLTWKFDDGIPNNPIKDLTIVTFGYNSPEFTEILMNSLTAYGVDLELVNFTIADNSNTNGDKELAERSRCNYIDNRNDRLNLNELSKKQGYYYSNSHSSLIQYAIDHCNTRYILLLDNDVCIRYPVSLAFEEFKRMNCLSSGYLQKLIKERIHPCYQFIDLNKYKELGCKFHYICNSKTGYDTGAEFYKNYSNYIIPFGRYPDGHIRKYQTTQLYIHYTSRSLVKFPVYDAPQFTNELERLINKDRKLIELLNKKITIYTYAEGNINHFPKIQFKSKNINYVIFTDRTEIPKDYIRYPLPELSNVYDRNKWVKWHPFEYFKCDIAIYMDFIYYFSTNPYKYLSSVQLSPLGISTHKHSVRNCAYEEITELIRCKRGNPEALVKYTEFLSKKGFPKKFGLPELPVIIYDRSVNKEFLEDVYQDYLSSRTYRDQPSFAYTLWRHGLDVNQITVLPNTIVKNPTFQLDNCTYKRRDSNYLNYDYSNYTLLTFNFNTTELTNNMIRTFLYKHNNFNGKIVVVDNSTIEMYEPFNSDIKVIDNTKGDYISYKVLDSLPKVHSYNNYASARHCMSIDYALRNLVKTDYVILMDSDTVFTDDILDVIKLAPNYGLIGDLIHKYGKDYIHPYACIINLKLTAKIPYFDLNRIMYVNGSTHDTGASFYEDLTSSGIPIHSVKFTNSIIHLKGGSYDNRKGRVKDFVIKHSKLTKF